MIRNHIVLNFKNNKSIVKRLNNSEQKTNNKKILNLFQNICDDESITEESYSGSQTSISRQGKESPEQNINRVNWTNRKDKFYSHNRNFNKSKLYTPKISGRQSDNNTSVSRIENKRLNLTERAQKSFIEERSKNLNKLFKGNGALGGIMQTILRKSTIIGKQDIDSYNIFECLKNKFAAKNKENNLLKLEEIEDNIISKYGCDAKFLDSIPTSRIEHLIKVLRSKHKKKDLELKKVPNESLNIKYNSDMSVYEEYLHLLLIKTSDKFIQDRYKDFINKSSQKKNGVNFFKRMEKDIMQREVKKEETTTDLSKLKQTRESKRNQDLNQD